MYIYIGEARRNVSNEVLVRKVQTCGKLQKKKKLEKEMRTVLIQQSVRPIKIHKIVLFYGIPISYMLGAWQRSSGEKRKATKSLFI